MPDQDPIQFGGLLRRLRTKAGLTQEELAEAAGGEYAVDQRSERSINLTARKDTARLLADALDLTELVRAEFEAAARGRPVPGGAGTGGIVAPTRCCRAISLRSPGDRRNSNSWWRLRRVRALW